MDFYLACENGSFSEVKHAVESGTDPYEHDRLGVKYACLNVRFSVIKYFTEIGIDCVFPTNSDFIKRYESQFKWSDECKKLLTKTYGIKFSEQLFAKL